jgi:hypothetical protein
VKIIYFLFAPKNKTYFMSLIFWISFQVQWDFFSQIYVNRKWNFYLNCTGFSMNYAEASILVVCLDLIRELFMLFDVLSGIFREIFEWIFDEKPFNMARTRKIVLNLAWRELHNYQDSIRIRAPSVCQISKIGLPCRYYSQEDKRFFFHCKSYKKDPFTNHVFWECFILMGRTQL